MPQTLLLPLPGWWEGWRYTSPSDHQHQCVITRTDSQWVSNSSALSFKENLSSVRVFYEPHTLQSLLQKLRNHFLNKRKGIGFSFEFSLSLCLSSKTELN